MPEVVNITVAVPVEVRDVLAKVAKHLNTDAGTSLSAEDLAGALLVGLLGPKLGE
jgi:hypothetical protein